jgi:hypothetical protein
MDVSRRGLFSFAAGAGAALATGAVARSEHSATAAEFPHEGFELTKLRWFNRPRGFGYATGLSSGHHIRIDSRVLQEAGIERMDLTTQYWVHWTRDGEHVVAQKISGSVPLTREELLKAMNWQERSDF